MAEPALGPIMMDLQGCSVSSLEAEQLRHPSVGGVILFTRNYQSPTQLSDLVQAIRAVRGELLIAADTEGGRVQRFRSGFLKHPAAARYGALWRENPDFARSAARAGSWLLAAELRALDIDLAFAPVLDIDTGSSGVIGDRALADDAHVVAELAQHYIAGMHAAGMAATGKHFPGHGFVVPDSHVELPEDERGLEQMQSQDLQPYRCLGNELLDSVMVAHVRYAAVDDLPASISPYWIGKQLRQNLAYQGAVFSDDLSMGGLASYGDVHARCQLALQAGCEMLPVCNRPEDVAALLDGPVLSISEQSQHRLRRLRRVRHWPSLAKLRASDDYQQHLSAINQYLTTEIAE